MKKSGLLSISGHANASLSQNREKLSGTIIHDSIAVLSVPHDALPNVIYNSFAYAYFIIYDNLLILFK